MKTWTVRAVVVETIRWNVNWNSDSLLLQTRYVDTDSLILRTWYVDSSLFWQKAELAKVMWKDDI
jgi:HJR/Mrr/RecB family endonuclease